jgi:hypothetical protein
MEGSSIIHLLAHHATGELIMFRGDFIYASTSALRLVFQKPVLQD